jgi:hypothetical protein
MLEKLPPEVGKALRAQRAGLDAILIQRMRVKPGLGTLAVQSSAFEPGGPIPTRYTADGPGVSPPLQWSGIPENASRVVVAIEDADSPTPHPFVHAIVVLRDVRDSSLIEGALNSPHHVGVGLETGPNSYLLHTWLPPDPPPGHGLHHYVFQVFALSECALSESPGRGEVFEVIEQHGLAAGAVVGTYERGLRDLKHEEAAEPIDDQATEDLRAPVVA